MNEPSTGVTISDVGTIHIRRSTLGSPDAGELIAALNAELTTTFPEPGATHFSLSDAQVIPGDGAFLVAYLDDAAVGCGAMRARQRGQYAAAVSMPQNPHRALFICLSPVEVGVSVARFGQGSPNASLQARECEADLRAASDFGFEEDASAVLLDDLTHEGEAEPR